MEDVGADGEVRGYLLDYLFFGDCEQVALSEGEIMNPPGGGGGKFQGGRGFGGGNDIWDG